MRCSVLMGGLDQPYMKQLVHYLMASSRHSFDITWIEQIEDCYKLYRDKTYNLVVLDEPFDPGDELIKQLGDVPYVILAEALTQSADQTRTVFKYQEVTAIEDAIYSRFREMTHCESVSSQGKPTKVIGCFSPVGGSGNTTISQIIARVRRSLGDKVLHLSLDRYPSYHMVYSSVQHHNLSDYLVYLMTKSNWLTGLEQMVATDERTGIHYMIPPIHKQDMQDFNEGPFASWLDHISSFGDYDTVVIDFAGHSTDNMLDVLAKCSDRVFTVRMDSPGIMKWIGFTGDLTKSGRQGMLDGARLIGNHLTGEQSSLAFNCDLTLEYDRDLMSVKDQSASINVTSVAYKKMEVCFNDF